MMFEVVGTVHADQMKKFLGTEKDDALNARILECMNEMDGQLSADGFIEPCSAEGLLERYRPLRDEVDARSGKILFRIGLADRGIKENIGRFNYRLQNIGREISEHNRRVALDRSVEVGRIINPVEGRDLDTQQLSTIAMGTRTRLVLAGAGTGKTTTIVGFVKYLIASGKATPDDILALSFTNASVDELKARIRAETGNRVETTTFHRLGMKIIASSDGKVPKVSNTDLRRFVMDEIGRRRSDSKYVRLLNRYLLYEFGRRDDESGFSDASDYRRYLHDNPLVTLKGERVKSTGEADIANFLAENGIPYEYEQAYEVDTNDSEFGQYHPDFHLKGTRVYIEYFGIDREGNVSPFMVDKDPNASEEYREGIEWKRRIHSENGTVMVELYSYEHFEGTLLDSLEEKLAELGVESSPISPEKVFDEFMKSHGGTLGTIASSFATILSLVKETGRGFDEIIPKKSSLSKILGPIYEAYRLELSRQGEIDFADMLNMASDRIRDGRYHHPYRYVVVDEYQDISASRFRLLESMRKDRDYNLYCVGDDWQSIYRFNGSDVSFILDFEKFWGPSSICKIETTYRFSGELLKISSEFILGNGRQIRKDLRGASGADCRVLPISASTESGMRYRIGTVLKDLPSGTQVLFLGRYNHDVVVLDGEGYSWKPTVGDRSISVFYSQRPDLRMTFRTIHGSKGLQADYVISLNNKTGQSGFPGARYEPPEIRLLLGSGNSQYDEERRLFYVAMTRARRRCYLATYTGRESPFFREVFGMNVIGKDEQYCPICGGRLVVRDGRFGEFIGCENFRSRGCKFRRKIVQLTEIK